MTDGHAEEIDEEGGYSRLKGKMQVGDGPDARGEVTVELVRGVEHDDHDTLFGEYALEMDRAVDHARNALGLDDPDDDEEVPR